MLDCEEVTPFAVYHFDIVIALVVLEQDIVFRAVLLYKRAFEHQRLEFAVAEDIVEVVDIIDHLTHLDGVVILRAKVGADPVFERLCLADIDYLALFVFHQINTGVQRQAH